MWIVVLAAVLLGGLCLWRFVRHSRPLGETEIARVAANRRRRAITDHYGFLQSQVAIDRAFKASMRPDGAFHSVEYPVQAALSIVASHLKHKRHEWVVLVLCRDQRAIGLWCNKGPDGTMVWPTIDLEEIAALGRRLGADTVIRAHNHPNSHGGHVSLLAPSDQDHRSAGHLGEFFFNRGLNYIDVVCERGRWLAFAERYVDAFYPLEGITAAVRSVNGTGGAVHRRLRREL